MTNQSTNKPCHIVMGELLHENSVPHKLVIVNTVFRKRYFYLNLLYSGTTKTDFVIVKNRDRSLVTGAKIVPCATIALRHSTLIYMLEIVPSLKGQSRSSDATSVKWW